MWIFDLSAPLLILDSKRSRYPSSHEEHNLFSVHSITCLNVKSVFSLYSSDYIIIGKILKDWNISQIGSVKN